MMPVSKRVLALLACVASSLALAQGQALPPPSNVLSLTSEASVEVSKDTLGVAFSVVREGADAGVVQTQVKQALDAALAEARKWAKPGALELQTGNFSLYPRYSQKGAINGWQGSAELLVEGKDTQGVAQLAGRIQTMTVARVAYRLSAEAREKLEGEVAAAAISRFRAKAEAHAKQFGFATYSVREVQVTNNAVGAVAQQAPLVRASMASASPELALPTEAGKETVTATVSGSIQMK